MKITFPNLNSTDLEHLFLLIAFRNLDLEYDYIIPVLKDGKIIGNIIITLGD